MSKKSTNESITGNVFQKSHKFLGIEFTPLWIPWERRMQTVGVLVWVLLSSFLALGSLFFAIFAYNNWILAFIYAGWIYYLDKETPNTGGRRFQFFRELGIWNHYRNYFPLKLIKSADLDPKRNYLFAAHPHGIFCSGPFACFATESLHFKNVFPGMEPHFLSLELFFKIPFARDILLAFGVCAATKKSMNYLLSYPKGGRVAILLPGGVPEMLESRPNMNIVKIKNRKGFIKLALQNGSPLVPVYTFGENDIYDQLGTQESSIIRRIQLTFVKLTSFCFPIVNGRGVFQYTFGLLPRRIPMTTVVGAPIEVIKIIQPTQHQIDSLHKQFCVALKELFYTHREQCGHPNAELQIT